MNSSQNDGSGLRSIGRSHRASKSKDTQAKPEAKKQQPKQTNSQQTRSLQSTSMTFPVSFLLMMKDMAHDLNRESKTLGRGSVSVSSMVRAAVFEFTQLSGTERLEALDKHRE